LQGEIVERGNHIQKPAFKIQRENLLQQGEVVGDKAAVGVEVVDSVILDQLVVQRFKTVCGKSLLLR